MMRPVHHRYAAVDGHRLFYRAGLLSELGVSQLDAVADTIRGFLGRTLT